MGGYTYLKDLLHEGLLLKSDHVMNKVEHCDETLGRKVGLGGEIEEEIHHSVAHVDAVDRSKHVSLSLASGRLPLIKLVLELND